MNYEIAPMTSAEIDRIFAIMPSEAASRILSFVDALAVFAKAADKAAAARAMSARLAPLGYKGLSLKSLYRKLDDFKTGGVWSLVPAKYKREEISGIAGNKDFLDYWHALVLENRRKMKPAWRKLVREFTTGAEIPGIGTWRDLYLRERGYMPGVGEPCPWSERNPPPGWSIQNLSKFAPDEFALEAARHGMAGAKAMYGLTVSKTRAGLACCRVVEVDDMWYEHAVVYQGNKEPQRVVEFAAMDRLTAHVIWRLAKPIREKADGTRETLKAAWAKYIYHAILCLSGIPPEGCIIHGERGTTKSDAEFEAALVAINRWREGQGLGAVRFESGSLANEPVAKGLHTGAAKGNPRHKGMIEQMHATLKNELGSVLGEIGGGRGVQPEETGAMVAEAKSLTALAYALNLPVERIAAPFLSWEAFAKAADEAHRRMDERTDHNLEGWAECGFTAGEMRIKGEAGWRSVPALSAMTPKESGAISALVKAGYAEFHERRLSPREAWERSKGELKALPAYFAPMILGRELGCTAKVRNDMKFIFKDPNQGTRIEVAAVCGEHLLSRGVEYRIWVNPLDGARAYVQDMQGRFMGVAKVLQAVRADATPEELAEQLGLRRRILAQEARRLAPIARRRLQAANDRAAANLAVFGFDGEEAGQCPTIAASTAATEGESFDFEDLARI